MQNARSARHVVDVGAKVALAIEDQMANALDSKIYTVSADARQRRVASSRTRLELVLIGNARCNLEIR
jgi:hypothetical protein